MAVPLVLIPRTPPPAAPTPADLLRLYTTTRSAATARLYVGALHGLARWLGTSLDALPDLLLAAGPGGTTAHVRGYVAALRARGAGVPTANAVVKAVRALCADARDLGLIAWTPALRAQPHQPRDMRGPAPEAVRALLAACDASTPKGARDAALVLVLYGLALRRAEVASLRATDVERNPAGLPVALHVRRKGRPGRVRRTVPPAVAAALARWLGHRGSAAGPLFRSCDRAGKGRGGLTAGGVYTVLRALARRAGVPPVRPHGLRHAAITAALNAGLDVRVVRHYSGHAQLQTLLTYDDDRRDFAGAVAAQVLATL